MALVYPLDFPTWLPGMSVSTFTLAYQQEIAPTGGGDIVRDLGMTLWNADFETPRLDPDDMAAFSAWLTALENGGQTFWGRDFTAEFPRNYPNGSAGMTKAGGGTFTGAGLLSAVASDNKTVTISGLPANFVFKPGDHIAFDYSGGVRAYHRCIVDASGNGSGVAVIEVRPHIRPGFATGVAVTLDKPKAKMRLIPDSAQPSPLGRGKGTWSFKATQTLQP